MFIIDDIKADPGPVAHARHWFVNYSFFLLVTDVVLGCLALCQLTQRGVSMLGSISIIYVNGNASGCMLADW